MNDIENTSLELIQKYQEGDEQAFTTLFYKYYPLVYSTLIAKGISKTDAEDSTAEIFIKLADSLINSNFDKPFEHYLKRIVRNKTYDLYRRKNLLCYPLVSDHMVSDYNNEIELIEIEEIINHCLQKIANFTRRAILVSWLEGYTRKQTAELLNLPIGTIHSNLERGKIVFKHCIQENLL